jgi:hypothetical protein
MMITCSLILHHQSFIGNAHFLFWEEPDALFLREQAPAHIVLFGIIHP